MLAESSARGLLSIAGHISDVGVSRTLACASCVPWAGLCLVKQVVLGPVVRADPTGRQGGAAGSLPLEAASQRLQTLLKVCHVCVCGGGWVSDTCITRRTWSRLSSAVSLAREEYTRTMVLACAAVDRMCRLLYSYSSPRSTKLMGFHDFPLCGLFSLPPRPIIPSAPPPPSARAALARARKHTQITTHHS